MPAYTGKEIIVRFAPKERENRDGSVVTFFIGLLSRLGETFAQTRIEITLNRGITRIEKFCLPGEMVTFVSKFANVIEREIGRANGNINNFSL